MLEGFTWLIPQRLAGMARPSESREALARLREAGIGAVVSLTERPLPDRLIEESGLVYLHLPIANYAPPLPEQVERFIEFCRENIAAGRAVAVHCLAGLGRTGTMLACYLVSQGMDPYQAIDTIRASRPNSIETAEQEAAIVQYASKVRRHKTPPPDDSGGSRPAARGTP